MDGLNPNSARVRELYDSLGFGGIDLDDEDLAELERPDYLNPRGARYWDPIHSEILDGLWQGGTLDEDVWDNPRLKSPGIKRGDFDTVVTLYADATPVDWFVKEIRYGVWDSDIGHMDLERVFELVRDTHTEWRRGRKTLVRCQAGWNRSGLVTALVLIRDGMPADEAIDLIRRRRSASALCNPSFERFLLAQDPVAWQGDSYEAAVAAAKARRLKDGVRKVGEASRRRARA